MAVATTPEAGVGITLGFRAASSGAYTTCAMLGDDCEFSGFDTTVILIKLLSSGIVTKVPGRTDNGEFTCTMYLVNADTGVTEVMTLVASKATVYWQVQLNDGTSGTTGSAYQFQGFVSNAKPGNFTGDDAATIDATIAISGAITLVPAT